jgi:hypothetical protein
VIHDSVDVFEQIIIRAVISVGIAVGLALLVVIGAVVFCVHLVRNHWIEVEEDTPTPTTDYSEAA